MCDRKKGNCEMGSFSVNTKSHGWVATIQEANMIKAGLSEEQYKNPQEVAFYFLNRWINSGKGREAGIAILFIRERLLSRTYGVLWQRDHIEKCGKNPT